MSSIKFGEIFWKCGSAKRLSSEGHYAVVLGVDPGRNEVLYQTLGSNINKIFHFPNEVRSPHIDVDTVSFLNYRKYQGILNRDTCLVMSYGADRELLPVFLSPRYRKCGVLSDHNRRALMISLRPSMDGQLRVSDARVIHRCYEG